MEQATHPKPRRADRTPRRVSRTVLFGLLACAGAAWAQPADVLALPPAEAESVLQRYFDGLRQGDVAALRRTLGCGLLSKQRILLGNPAFGPRLAAYYGSARIRVVGHRLISRDRVEIDAVVEPAGAAPQRRRITLQRRPTQRGAGRFVVCAEAATPAASFAAVEFAPRRAPTAADLRSLARERPESIEQLAAQFVRPESVLP